MLRQDVVAAVTAGQFHVFTIATVDDAIALLFAPEGQTKIDSSEIDHSMRSRVEELYEIRRRLAQEEKTKNDE
jgi:predicted ATP-dependent protease